MEKKQIKVLLIEDNPGDVRLMQEFLKDVKGVSFSLQHTDRLEAGLTQIARERVDVILLDLSLPDSHGIDTFLKAQAQAQGIPIVVLTGLYDEAFAVRAVHEGAQDYLVKGQAGADVLVRSIRYAIERQRIEEELRRSNALNQSIVKALPFGMDIVSAEGDILYLSENFEAVFGKSAVGKKCWLIYKDDQKQCYDCSLKTGIKIGEVDSIEVEGIAGNKIFQIMHIGLMYQGKKAVLEIFNDITERKHIEQMKSDFVAMVSHQLKTPVGEMRGYIDNIISGLTGPLNEKQQQYLSDMQTINAREYRLISDLLNVSRIERGIISVCLQPVDLKETVELALKDFRDKLQKRGLRLECQGFDQKIIVLADKDKLMEAISNVIDNAIKFTKKGSIIVSLRAEGKFGYIEIQDSGIGISTDALNKLFTRDQTLSGSPSAEGGAGLGLFIAKSFMQLQRGDVTVESQVNRGSKFIFKISLSVV